MTIAELGAQLRSGKLSSLELVRHALDNIKKRERFNSLITLDEERALNQATERDKELAAGIDRGPLHGIPTAHKDLFCTRGLKTTGGSLVFRDFVPNHDATAVDKLELAGAVTIGKANLHELAYGSTSKNPHYGFVLNPRDPERVAGGSSGGSAALVAAGFMPMSLGTDTGGSIRIPASFCGVTGFKPTYGRVSRYGVLPLSFSLDHVGPIGTCVEDCAIAMDAIAGFDSRDETSVNLQNGGFNLPPLSRLDELTVGLPLNFYFDCIDHEVKAAVHRATLKLEELGAKVVEIKLPDMHGINASARVVQLSEAAALYVNYTDPSQFGADVWSLIEQGRLISAHEYVNAQRLRALFRRDFDAVWAKVDLIATPATPIPAPRVDEQTVQINCEAEDVRIASTRLVRAINFLGEPAISMPCGRTQLGLPIGLQLISPPFTDPELLQVARTLESHLEA
ncbi:MAG: amidase [Acidobacteriaceae bacterium]|nr:amidase [Acidobacteriaceae bacterium]